jgi:hypothetical protein
MAVKTSWNAGDVLTAADLTDTFAAKAPSASPTFTGTVDLTGATVTGLAAAGLTLITTQAFTTASAVNVNSCFTSTYENYVVTVNADASTSAATTIRLRASAADNSTNNYRWAGYYQDWAVNLNGDANTAQTSWPGSTNDGQINLALTLFSPQMASRTRAYFEAFGNTRSGHYTASFDATTQFDGFSIIRASGTITGSLSVYGYAK